MKHRPVLQIPPVNIIAAPGAQDTNAQLGLQQVNAMAGRGRNNNQALEGADPSSSADFANDAK